MEKWNHRSLLALLAKVVVLVSLHVNQFSHSVK